tara:strand:- start:1 stop:438 length:438 start_codon:yes stop_codon:yes gene_type:complete
MKMSKYYGGGPTPFIFIKYTGTNDKLISGNEYSIIDLAKAHGMSYQVAYNRLRGKTEAKESDLYGPNMDKALLIKFEGKHEGLINNKSYTLKQLGKVCGISGNAMYGRLKKRPVCTPNDLRCKQIYVTKKTPDAVSTHWLRRKLV